MTVRKRKKDDSLKAMAKAIGNLQARVTRLERKRRPIGFEPVGSGLAREAEEQDEPNYEDNLPED